MNNRQCFKCGACCIAYSISTLKKTAGIPCHNLKPDGKCGDYENRPAVCREFKADNLCFFIQGLPLKKQVEILIKIYE